MIVREVVLLCFYSSALSYKQLCSSFLPFFVRDVRDDSQPSNLSEWKLIWSKVQQIILLAVKKIPVGKGWFFGSSCGLAFAGFAASCVYFQRIRNPLGNKSRLVMCAICGTGSFCPIMQT